MIGKSELYRRPDIRLGALKDLASDNRAKDYYIRLTSGTTKGEPMLVVKNRLRQLPRIKQTIYRGLNAPVLFWGTANARFALATYFLFIFAGTGKRVLVPSADDLAGDLEALLLEFKPDGFSGLSSFIAEALLKIQNEELLKSIKCLRLIGEGVTKAQAEIFNKKLPKATIECYYATVEAGYVSLPPCRYLKINTYHPAPDLNFRIIDADADGVGEIMVDPRQSASVLIHDYATGDLGRLIEEKCPCGSQITFEVLGRKDYDFMKFLGATLRQEVFEEELNKFGFVKDFRVLAREVTAGDKLLGEITVQLSFKNGTEPAHGQNKAAVEAELPRRLFLTPTRTLEQLVREGIFLPLKVEAVDDFPPLVKKIKMKKVE